MLGWRGAGLPHTEPYREARCRGDHVLSLTGARHEQHTAGNEGDRKLSVGRHLQMLSDFRSARLISLGADGTWAHPFSVGAPGPPSYAVPPAEFLTWGWFAHVSDLPWPFSSSTQALHLLWLPKARRWDGALGWHNTSLSPRLAALCPGGTAAPLSGLRDWQG